MQVSQGETRGVERMAGEHVAAEIARAETRAFFVAETDHAQAEGQRAVASGGRLFGEVQRREHAERTVKAARFADGVQVRAEEQERAAVARRERAEVADAIRAHMQAGGREPGADERVGSAHRVGAEGAGEQAIVGLAESGEFVDAPPEQRGAISGVGGHAGVD